MTDPREKTHGSEPLSAPGHRYANDPTMISLRRRRSFKKVSLFIPLSWEQEVDLGDEEDISMNVCFMQVQMNAGGDVCMN